jgi:CRP-like cAMP-binding protein
VPRSSSNTPAKTGNHLLDALTPDGLAALQPHLEAVPLRINDIVQNPGQRAQFSFFPTCGMISVIATMSTGATVEVGLVGREGMFNIAVILGDPTPSQKGVVQLSGSALRIRTAKLIEVDHVEAELHALLLRYAQVQLVQASQSAACNRLHQLEMRCARWILSAHDRADGASFAMTHEFLATMLGVRRPGVTAAVKALRSAGMIDYRHGSITVQDRRRLEAAACECYRYVQDESTRILGRA